MAITGHDRVKAQERHRLYKQGNSGVKRTNWNFEPILQATKRSPRLVDPPPIVERTAHSGTHCSREQLE